MKFGTYNITRLKIIRGKQQGSGFKFDSNDSSSAIEVCFNPTEYSLNKTNSYSEAKIPGLGSPIIQFSQGDAQTLDLELMLDSSLDSSSSKTDIREKYIEPLEKLVKLDSDLHAPPPCRIIWGSLDFTGVLKSMKKQYILFSRDGNPIRAKVSLNFSEYIPLDLQVKEASLSSPDRRKLHRVNDSDRIWKLSDQAYGDPSLWRVLAEANDIDDPGQLQSGTDLIIPVLEPQAAT
jgi:hypothetical protein